MPSPTGNGRSTAVRVVRHGRTAAHMTSAGKVPFEEGPHLVEKVDENFRSVNSKFLNLTRLMMTIFFFFLFRFFRLPPVCLGGTLGAVNDCGNCFSKGDTVTRVRKRIPVSGKALNLNRKSLTAAERAALPTTKLLFLFSRSRSGEIRPVRLTFDRNNSQKPFDCTYSQFQYTPIGRIN